MILFIAPFPRLSDEKDGFIQRIAWIDSLVSNNERTYLDISLGRFIFAKTHTFERASVRQLNFFVHFFLIMKIIKSADIVYIHSIYNSLRAISAYFIGKPITDMHGIVPEEMVVAGKPWRAKIFGAIEKLAIKRSWIAIYVTDAMKEHFEKKYQRDNAIDRVLAILPKLSDPRGKFSNVMSAERGKSTVVYAGGIQSWQNVELMLESAAKCPSMKYVFLTSDQVGFENSSKNYQIVNFECHSAPAERVPDYYLSANFGFILRSPILVNKVACPTKLVEYFFWGVIPIVLSSDIGDFLKLGFKFLELESFCRGDVPEEEAIKSMREANRLIVDRLYESSSKSMTEIREILVGECA